MEDGVNRGLRGPLAVGVLDPQQHFSTAPAGVKPVEQGGARSPDMQEARGRGSKAGDNSFVHAGRFATGSPLQSFGGVDTGAQGRNSVSGAAEPSARSV